DNGTFEYLFNKLIGKKRGATAQMILLLLFIAIPGMLTGTAAACVATTGLMVGRYLIGKGVEKAKAVELVAVGSLLGMLMPPLCLPAMTVVVGRQGSYPASFEGYFVPLLILALPALLVYGALSGKRILGETGAEPAAVQTGSPLCLLPILVVGLLLLAHNFLYFATPFLGYPLIYMIGFILAIFVNAKKASPLESAARGVRIVAPAVALMFATGAISEVLTMVGSHGTLSTALVLGDVSPVVLSVVCMLALTLSGLVLGGPFAFTVSAVCSYLIGALVYPNSEMALVASGAALAVAMFLSARGGLIGTTCDTLEVSGVSSKQILQKSAVPVGLVLLVSLIFAFAYASVRFLMV
ncbi:MAG: TRAP transporter large permease subunit, partial [Oscillospiraceae bacterium]